MISKLYTLFILLVTGVGSGYAQLSKIDTDRPDQTESAFTVPKNWLQFELGLNFQRNEPSDNEFLVPTLLTKYGISKRVELRLISSLRRYRSYDTNGKAVYQKGIEPLELGTKIALAEEKGWLPKTTLLFHVVLPTLASKDLRADKLAPNFRFSMQNTITKKMALGYNLGAEWDGFNNEPGWVYTISPGFDLSEKWYAYIEAFGVVSKLESPQHNIDGGAAYYINPNFKVDISSGFGISKAAPAWYLAVGASLRMSTGKKVKSQN